MRKYITNIKLLVLFYALLFPIITFGQGARYSGTYKKASSIEYVRKNNLTIEGLELPNISLYNCDNITIKNCKLGPTAKKAIYLWECSNITIIDCTFENVQTALLASRCTNNIKFEYNDVKNIQGGSGNESAQMVQFTYVNGAGHSISYNACENIKGESSVEDIINLFSSNGTPQSPITVSNNWIRGGGPSMSGGGINLGDSGGSYQIAENNILVNPGQYGIGMSGGSNLTLKNNKVYSKQLPFSNVGMTIWDWWGAKGSGSYPMYDITAENNEINWTHRDGFLHNMYIHKNAGEVKSLNTNRYNSNINESLLPEQIIGRAKMNETEQDSSKPEDNEVGKPSSEIAKVYIDKYNRIAIKYLVNPIPHATGEAYSSTGKLLEAITLPRYNKTFSIIVPKGEYLVKIYYKDLGKTETTKIIVN